MFELRRALEAQEDLQRKVIELSAPVLPLLPDVLVLPLVGAIDAGRITRVLDELLHSITQHRARVVIIDITGVPVVDTSVAAQLISVANAARLLGCKTMLVGIRPEIAQTIVSLGLTMDQLSTLASLAEGLRAALGEVGLQLVPKARHFV
ncbi:MAG: hypothetical protein KatS3mg057_1891 [Herpetosiphonaceae bacterium]|nr:MAG: hypothetical protein KatS3mg057_1891 [Herpetosiphonaceae bacterium]